MNRYANAVLLCAAGAAVAAAQSAPGPSFEVASIKINASGDYNDEIEGGLKRVLEDYKKKAVY